MAEVQYLGPSDKLFVRGHEYQKGDVIHLSAEAIGNLTRQGERFGYLHDDQELAVALEPAATFTLASASVEIEPDPKPKPAPAPDPEPVPAPKAEQHPVRAASSAKKESD